MLRIKTGVKIEERKKVKISTKSIIHGFEKRYLVYIVEVLIS